MINPQWLELPMFRTNFHGPKDVRAIEIRLYSNLILNLTYIDSYVTFMRSRIYNLMSPSSGSLIVRNMLLFQS